MARSILLVFDDEESSFAFSKVDREKLYGKRDRLVVDEDGKTCQGASLTTDGAAIIPPGGLAYTYLDESWDSLERSELRAVDESGAALVTIPSTLGVAQALTGPIDASRVLEHTCVAVYELRAESVSERLSGRLTSGDVFETRFNYRDDYSDSPAFLLGNEHGVFLLVAEPTEFALVRREQEPAPLSDDGEDADDLDFGMM